MIRRKWLFTIVAIFSLTGTLRVFAADSKTVTPKKPDIKKEQKAEAKSAPSKPGDTVTPVPRDEKWMQRHEKINELVKNSHVGVLFIGDSITQGWEGAGKDVWEKYYTRRFAVNLGIGGDRTQHVLWRLDHGNVNIEGVPPRVAIIMIGTNNIGRDTPEQIADGVIAIQDKLKAKLYSTAIIQLAIFPRGATPDDPKRQAVAKTNEILKERSTGDKVHYLDIGKEFLQPDGTLTKEIMPDLLHLSPKGYEIWAKSIEQSLADITEPVDKDLKK